MTIQTNDNNTIFQSDVCYNVTNENEIWFQEEEIEFDIPISTLYLVVTAYELYVDMDSE